MVNTRLDYLNIYVKAKKKELDNKRKNFIREVNAKLKYQKKAEEHEIPVKKKIAHAIHNKVISRVNRRLNKNENHIFLKEIDRFFSALE